MEYGDIPTFYEAFIEMMDQEIDIDMGKMYLGSSEKYEISLMVMETKTKSDSNMVRLEILRK